MFHFFHIVNLQTATNQLVNHFELIIFCATTVAVSLKHQFKFLEFNNKKPVKGPFPNYLILQCGGAVKCMCSIKHRVKRLRKQT